MSVEEATRRVAAACARHDKAWGMPARGIGDIPARRSRNTGLINRKTLETEGMELVFSGRCEMLVDGGDKCRDGCSGGFYVYVEAQRNSSRARNWTDYRDGGLGE